MLAGKGWQGEEVEQMLEGVVAEDWVCRWVEEVLKKRHELVNSLEPG